MTGRSVLGAGQGFPVGDVIAGVICLAGCITFLFMALALPAGHSTGDTGPGALPEQVAVFGTVCSAAYLVLALRRAFAHERPDFSASGRALAAYAIFLVCMSGAGWIGLPLALALASALVTLLFAGERPLIRAAATGAGIWLIAVLLFGKLLGLPMP
ncbi:tripartite tricarboxylate transporter TctB family protein [Paracoccus pantotrophus]|uniref:Tripartite tricarboxylate transporter TctB family protein n=1 Tax=Paracoccus pantotrophus TaxID=82367 RepID=A0AAE6NVS1_PARPN|nr:MULTISPECIES: tripartite tricarboxylate transporter TctB family protein [Paracoccus]QFG37329.1 tripartite tricarboxylate transporter TctB family protein [Paracoccus pantotrophus]RKS52235.1 tripartite tricarboxylate transporter TctB family protein [Paracoccus pantotrophus]UFS67329.1 tripartite tricarboxylate transporter TctB family protein [Paracoccus denitrificans]